jgi:hypothetical protein
MAAINRIVKKIKRTICVSLNLVEFNPASPTFIILMLVWIGMVFSSLLIPSVASWLMYQCIKKPD